MDQLIDNIAPGPSRKDVQQTSLLAFHEVRKTLAQRQGFIYAQLRLYPNSTARELAMYIGYADPNKVRPRMTELKKMGLIEPTGMRTCKVSLSTAQTWKVRGI